MFGFKRKSKHVNEINRLLGLLEKNPGDAKSRLTLANLYLQTRDQGRAINEYHAAAKQLSAKGFTLEPIAIYKKILTLEGISLTEKSRAAVHEAEELLAKAREAYEEVFQIEPQDDGTTEASESHHGDSHEGKDDLEEEEIPNGDDPESVPVQLLLDPSQDQAEPKPGLQEEPEDDAPDQEPWWIEPSPSGGLRESNEDARDQEPLESLDPPFCPPDTDVKEGEVQDPIYDAEITPEADSSFARRDSHIDLNTVQIDDDLETMLSDHESEPDPREKSSPLDTPEAMLERSDPEDPDLHYNLGIACYEMDLIDKAIKEFVKAADQGVRTAESLFMLAKCYCRKGLPHNAAGFIDQALKLDNLTQEQIRMLKGQLEEIKARRSSVSPSHMEPSDS